MKYEFTEPQVMIREAARQFAEQELALSTISRDENAEFPRGAVKKLGELGFMGMMVPEEYGGAGLDTVSYVLAIEEISKVDAACGVVISVNNSLVERYLRDAKITEIYEGTSEIQSLVIARSMLK